MLTRQAWLDAIGSTLIAVEAGELPAEALADLAIEAVDEGQLARDTNVLLAANLARLQEVNRRLHAGRRWVA